MKSTIVTFSAILLLTGCSHTALQLTSSGTTESGAEHAAPHPEEKSANSTSTGATVKKDYAKILSASPRHQEWVQIKSGSKTIHTFIVWPEKREKSKVVLIIHENRGLNDWARNMADQVAAEGYIAVAPDLLSDFSDTYKRTSDFPTEDDAIKALGTLDQVSVTWDIIAVTNYAKNMAASNGKVVSAGFCWGGSQSFRLATATPDLSAALVFYGSAPANQADLAKISAPVYGFYGGNDERINSTLPKTTEFMAASGKKFEPVTYSGAGHAFMRSGEDMNPMPANQAARGEAWERMKSILREE